MPEHELLGFTAQDREVLITVKVQLGYLQETVSNAVGRIAKLEETRLTSRDIEELMADTDTLREEKKDLEVRVTALERWQWKVIGASAAVGAIVGLLFSLLGIVLKH